MSGTDRAAELGFAYCVRRLAAAPRTEHDLRTRLAARGYEPDVIDAVLERLRRARYVDDAEYARMWVSSRARTKALAAPVLRLELRRKGVADELIDEALERWDAGAEDERAKELLRKRLPASLPDDRGELDRLKRRLGGVLARKGYSGARIWSLVDEVIGPAR